MFEVMKEERGIGLAANQIGHSVSIFVLGIEGNNEAFINPEVVSQENEIDYEEGCLSIPGVMAKTKRFNKLTLRYTKPTDASVEVRHEETYEGIKAIAVQHEMDHLNGKLYIDQFGPVKRQMVVDKHRKFLKHAARRQNG